MRFLYTVLLASLSLFSRLISTSVYICCVSPSVELQIRNRLSLFALTLDTDTVALLGEVFTHDASAAFGPPNMPYTGLLAIEAAYAFLNNLTI